VGERRLVTPSEYARLRGVTPQAVYKAARTGRITLLDGKVDVEVADIQWRKNTDPAQQARALGQREAPAPGGVVNSARERNEAAQAALRELELAEKRGVLVERAAVDRTVFTKQRIARDRVLGMSARLAPQIAEDPEQRRRIYDLIHAEAVSICEELANGEPAREGELQ
jgi:hypothetical protein